MAYPSRKDGFESFFFLVYFPISIYFYLFYFIAENRFCRLLYLWVITVILEHIVPIINHVKHFVQWSKTFKRYVTHLYFQHISLFFFFKIQCNLKLPFRLFEARLLKQSRSEIWTFIVEKMRKYSLFSCGNINHF